MALLFGTIRVCKIEKQKDELKLYGDQPYFYVVAPLNTKVEVGDKIVFHCIFTGYFGIFQRVERDLIN